MVVFLGPSCVFTNDYRPRAEIVKEYVKTIVSDGVSIGANATIVCGIPWVNMHSLVLAL